MSKGSISKKKQSDALKRHKENEKEEEEEFSFSATCLFKFIFFNAGVTFLITVHGEWNVTFIFVFGSLWKQNRRRPVTSLQTVSPVTISRHRNLYIQIGGSSDQTTPMRDKPLLKTFILFFPELTIQTRNIQDGDKQWLVFHNPYPFPSALSSFQHTQLNPNSMHYATFLY